MRLNEYLSPLQHFLLGILAWLPLCFIIWYYLAVFHLAPVTLISETLLQFFWPESLLWLELRQGTVLIMVTNFAADASGAIVSPPVGEDALGFELNPLIYSYSLPLFCALILATPSAHKSWKLLLGVLLLLPLEVFSMVMSVLKRLAFDVGEAFQMQQAWSGTALDMVAVLYQLSHLLLPMIAPLIIWMALQYPFVVQLAPQWQRLSTR